MKDTSRLLQLLEERGEALHALLVRITLREDVAEDLLQDLFVRLEKSASFARATNAYAFARTTAMRLAFDWRRSIRVRQADTLGAEPASELDSPLARAVANEEIQSVLDTMAQLSESDCQIVTMRYLQQASYDEVAEEIGTTTHQARGRCAKAMSNLRRLLEVSPAEEIRETPHAD